MPRPPQLLHRELTEAEEKPWRKVVKAAINTCTPRLKAEREAGFEAEATAAAAAEGDGGGKGGPLPPG